MTKKVGEGNKNFKRKMTSPNTYRNANRSEIISRAAFIFSNRIFSRNKANISQMFSIIFMGSGEIFHLFFRSFSGSHNQREKSKENFMGPRSLILHILLWSPILSEEVFIFSKTIHQHIQEIFQKF